MGVAEDLADELARDVIKYIDATGGDEKIIADIVGVLGASSQTAEEAFLTAIRVRRANIKARALLMERARAFKAEQEAKAGAAKQPE
ncbi:MULTISPECIES: hypothetical protein [Roseovarius]|uniref:Uncharacterized protein n=2 Tax=Roseovarius nubinhibens TaxID=314263 RepID=A3SPJ9_ROSNI|nr:hypothetical protein [Roseovarius nubinhibens]EAP76389.1 hypothetical protein ISM_16025 [Roseovarius nubinhibens ISM]MBU3001403.1 hypothetical protein [Roseovarius nubinhibens]HAR52012.1 hypothetical protein [Roseovarius nubinhibens]|tara:strand:+ start:1322 stop:1582 length:261 start_codon:yes stop_codon:yes gene_type:complete